MGAIIVKADIIGGASFYAGGLSGDTFRMGKKRKKGLRPNFIAAWRRERGLTQAQLALRVNLGQGSISDLENCKFEYTQGTLEAIADALTCQPWELIWRPPGIQDRVRAVIEDMDAKLQKKVLAVIQAIKDSEAA